MLKKNYDITDKLTAKEMGTVGIETINKQCEVDYFRLY